jgi:molybdate transport system substrate-binding protein
VGKKESRAVKWRSAAIGAIVACFMAAGPWVPVCARAADSATGQPLVVFAAASTSNAIGEIKRRFSEASGVQVQTSYGSSAVLARQIQNGADADVFLSADVASVDYLVKQGLVARQRTLLANRLVVILPSDSTAKVNKLEDLLVASVEHLALGDPQSVPAGKYAKHALEKLGLWQRLRPKVAAAADVRGALAFVETGAAEAGIVYATDAAISKKVKVACTIPEQLTGPIRYPVVLLKRAENRPAARSFCQYLTESESRKVFRKYGFIPVCED